MANDPSQSTMAAAQVFGTYEVLESILLHLPLFDLLLVERVSSQFQAVIKRSKKIGQALYREAAIERTTMVFDCFDKKRGWFTEGRVLQHPIINPFIAQSVYDDDDGLNGILHDGFVDMRSNKGKHERVEQQVAALPHRGASWKPMLMMQPPPRRVAFRCWEEVDEEVFDVERENGVTLNRMRRCLVDHWQECPNCPICGEDQGENVWRYWGQEYVELVEGHITGWQMLEEIWKRAPTS